MIEKVDLVFNYGGKWVLKPEVMYLKKLKHMMQDFDADLLSYIDICAEYTEKLGFSKVKQVLVNGPSGRYFLIENDACIIALQSLLCTEFNELQLYAVDENELFVPSPSIISLQPLLSNQVSELQLYAMDKGELPVSTPNIIDQNERHNIAVDVGTDCDSSDEEKNVGLNSSDRDSEELELFRKEITQDVNEKLDKFLHLEKGMSFKDLFEAKRVVGFYAVANKVNEKIKNMGEGSSQKVQDVTLTTAHESQTFEQEQQFDQHSTIGDDEWEGEEEDEDEDGQPILRPKVVSEERTRLQQKKLQRRPTGTRKISFKGDEFGVVEPTNLPYSQRKLPGKARQQ
ncbi:hypothetical protein KY284_036658 [Solanum tuberosum]|nr:hypothetical protein KY284_036658 [Solanum tuberosum]